VAGAAPPPAAASRCRAAGAVPLSHDAAGASAGWPTKRVSPGTLLASPGPLEVTTMFAVAAVLIGILGIFYVRRRSARKKQSA
jgi:hypothetical protein